MIEGFHLGVGGAAGQVCLMHGFTGSPWDLRPLGDALAQVSFEVRCPRLPGHGFPDGGEENSWPAWLARGQACVDEAIATAGGRPLVIAGLSMGGLLTLQLARDNADQVAAITIFAPAVSISRFNRMGIWVLGQLSRIGFGASQMPKSVAGLADPHTGESNPGSNPFPFSAFRSFGELRQRTRKMVGEVVVPTLIIQGMQDETCPPAGADWLADALGSTDVTQHVLDNSGHVITRDVQAPEASAAMISFLGERLA